MFPSSDVCQWHQKVGKEAHNQGASTHSGSEVLLKKLETIKGVHPTHQRWILEPANQEGVPPDTTHQDDAQIAGK
ncbi:hypothetical protein VP01_2213g3 [Puccinia sorghi]|uniref:Uncharacterized protein n=1 Tax=Puccinia sorghi TaxID=27349 RepID=A0A0L6V8R0_9BASI|nr:hypothetical protein VP01_2213g3 [Puccinia sorghi]